jgi:hypothetical protein
MSFVGCGLTGASARSLADIQSPAEFLNFMAHAKAGDSATILPGLDLGQVDLSNAPRKLGTNALTLTALDPQAPKWRFTGTGQRPALNLAGWSGVTLDGFAATHDGMGVQRGGIYVLDFYGSGGFITLRNASISATRSPNNLVGGATFRDCSNVLVDRCKFEDVALGVYNCAASYFHVRESLFRHIREDHIRTDLNGAEIRNITIERNLFEDPRPMRGDHFDFYQAYAGTSGSLDSVLIQENCGYYYGADTDRGQGFFLDNGYGNNPAAYSNIIIRNNVVMGTSVGGIFLNGCRGPGNLVEGNECYSQRGASAGAKIRFVDSDVAYRDNDAEIFDEGRNQLLNLGASRSIRSADLDYNGMRRKVEEFRSKYALVPR